MSAVAQGELSGKRVLILGAETEVGRAIASALAEAGADLALVAATSDAEAAFAVQRLARRLAAPGRRALAQAIDATNEMAVRVMVRQVSKELGGLDAIVLCEYFSSFSEQQRAKAMDLAIRSGGRELQRSGGGRFITVLPGWGDREPIEVFVWGGPPINWELVVIGTEDKSLETIGAEAVKAVAGEAASG